MRYIGSKSNLLTNIESVINQNVNERCGVFCDIFSGTGSVARYFKPNYEIHSKLTTLKKVVGVFKYNSENNNWLKKERLPLLKKYQLISNEDYERFQELLSQETIEVNYLDLKGKGAGNKSRTKAICSGLIQAVIDGQQPKTYYDDLGNSINIKKPYTDDWSAEGFLRWAISCGLLLYNNKKDTCTLSQLGNELSACANNSPEEKEILTQALLSYPPVCRVLSLLSTGTGLTKFEIGRQLGFYGELGFTSIPQNIFAYDYCTATGNERKKVKSNEEGDSDKYARGIASWCSQMGWIESKNEQVTETYREVEYTIRLQKYYITREGEKALKRSNGNSSNPKTPKIVLYEMLASNKAPDSNFLRLERSYVIKSIKSSAKSIKQIKNYLLAEQIDVSESSIRDDLLGLEQIGINISKRNEKYKITDRINGLIIPSTTNVIKEDFTKLKDSVRERLVNIDHKYLVLVDLAYSDASSKSKKNSDAREFEIQTAELFTKELNFNGMRLGDANRPDVIISNDTNGTIIDNKSYKNGLNIDKKCADEMSRYINENAMRKPGLPTNEWWKNFKDNIDSFTFLFITSFLKGNYKSQLEYISKSHSGILGAAISVDNLLFLAEKIKSEQISKNDFFALFCNNEIVIN